MEEGDTADVKGGKAQELYGMALEAMVALSPAGNRHASHRSNCGFLVANKLIGSSSLPFSGF
jgi:hypothetical protein